MAGKLTAHKHLDLSEDMLSRLKREAKEIGIPVSEIIRRKLERPPVEEEILILRKLRVLLKK